MNEVNPIRCLVVDDEPLAVALLADYVQKTPGLELVLRTSSALEALHKAQEGAIDLLFLDVQMPELTGIQLMKILRNSCKVILTTAYPDFALQGYEFDVVDYLLKPITYDRFLIAVNKVQERFKKSQQPTPELTEDHFFVKTEYRIQKVAFSSIYYIEALRDYIALHTTSGKILSLESMKNMEAQLPANLFIRIHKSYIINRSKIDFLERGKVVINKEFLPVGDTYKERFLAQIKII